jgi:hypothetical protein
MMRVLADERYIPKIIDADDSEEGIGVEGSEELRRFQRDYESFYADGSPFNRYVQWLKDHGQGKISPKPDVSPEIREAAEENFFYSINARDQLRKNMMPHFRELAAALKLEIREGIQPRL